MSALERAGVKRMRHGNSGAPVGQPRGRWRTSHVTTQRPINCYLSATVIKNVSFCYIHRESGSTLSTRKFGDLEPSLHSTEPTSLPRDKPLLIGYSLASVDIIC